MRNCEWPFHVTECLRVLHAAGFEAFAVGGCVRDLLRGAVPQDYDIATDAPPDDIIRVFSQTVPTGLKYGTVTVIMDTGSVEVTTFRSDGAYSDGRHPDAVTFSRTIGDDLARRDFTVNAMAWSPGTGLVDPFGGREDLRRRLIRAVGNPEQRFEEDALRILRAFRFAAVLDFTIHTDTMRAALRGAGALARISAERVGSEIRRILLSPCPVRLQPLLEAGGLAAWGIGEGTLTPLRDVPAHLPARLAALCILTRSRVEEVSIRLRFDNRTRRGACLLTEAFGRPLPETPADMRRLLGWLPAGLIRDLCGMKAALSHDDPVPALALLESVLTRGEAYKCSMLRINGHDLLRMGAPPGKELGILLQALLSYVVEEPERNTSEALRKEACRRIGAGMISVPHEA